MQMIRSVLAVIAGLAIGMVANMALVMLNITLHPLPDGVDFNDAEGLSAYFATLPFLAYLMVLLAHLSQAFFGAWAAALISRRHAMAVAMVVGVLTLVGGVLNMQQMPLPAWMWIEMPFYLLAAWIPGRWVSSRHRGAAGHD